MVLVAEANDPSSPEGRAVAAVWNHVHSIPSRLAGLRLAVLLRSKPAVPLADEGGPVAVAWLVPRGAEYEARIIRVGFPKFAAIVTALDLRDVLLAEPEVPRDVLERIGFRREVSESQVTGFWFDRGERIPREEPTYFPSMAVLPAIGCALTDAPCVFAVAVDWTWHPLSETAVYTYSHASELVEGREGIFIRQGARWPEPDRPAPESVFRVKHADFVEGRDVGRRYGVDVAHRARTGARLMLVTLAPSDARPR
jgi:hypothetical protein